MWGEGNYDLLNRSISHGKCVKGLTSQPRHELSRVKYFVSFLSPSRQMPYTYTARCLPYMHLHMERQSMQNTSLTDGRSLFI
jgi:hypothetical protein